VVRAFDASTSYRSRAGPRRGAPAAIGVVPVWTTGSSSTPVAAAVDSVGLVDLVGLVDAVGPVGPIGSPGRSGRPYRPYRPCRFCRAWQPRPSYPCGTSVSVLHVL